MAYQVNHNTVIRGSYGIYYVPEPLNLLLQSMRTNPPINLAYSNQIYLNPNAPARSITASTRMWWPLPPPTTCLPPQ